MGTHLINWRRHYNIHSYELAFIKHNIISVLALAETGYSPISTLVFITSFYTFLANLV